ncbi:DUF1648 domain-containing protein [Gottfriedia sp. NPDC056225]|uniref:DUF1648 domain-containing protein n=1 Tax=Gottfriedia sp. NPDC056225 TaxID=3345751 RepID=UPI0035D8D836
MTKIEQAVDIVSFILLVFKFGYSFYIWKDLPKIIPAHFNTASEREGWGGRNNVLQIAIPIIGIVLYAVYAL